ncbi:MAG TPA: hypothetical protein VM389_02615 [Phycisphaerae bacterium]|nr:hypothetical protein [Phycisphaerae bacterium]
MTRRLDRLTRAAVVLAVAAAMTVPAGCEKKKGKKSRGYIGAVIYALTVAEIRIAKTNLATLGRELEACAIEDDKFPPSLEALVESRGVSKSLIMSLGKKPHPLSYIPGQTPASPADNVLVYDDNAVYDKDCLLLRVSGQVELIPPEALKEAVEQTRTSLGLPAE